MKVHEAKNFLVERIKRQALLEQTPLSDLEIRMLSFTENDEPEEDPLALNAEFEEHYDSDEYENKISRLMRHAYRAACAEGLATKKQWNAAMHRLSQGDHYLPVMWDARPALRLSSRRALILGNGGILAVLGLLWLFQHFAPPDPRLLLVIVAGLALAGYAFRRFIAKAAEAIINWAFSIQDSDR